MSNKNINVKVLYLYHLLNIIYAYYFTKLGEINEYLKQIIFIDWKELDILNILVYELIKC